MKNPHSLNPTWSRSVSENPLLVSVASMNKKVKRKSREPRKMKLYPDLVDVDSVDDSSMEICNVSMLAPLQRQLMMSQDAMAGAPGGLSGLPEDTAPAQSGAIDMRIGINVPSISSKMSRLSSPPFSEISHWPTSISQPLSNRLKLGLQSTFSSTSGGHSPSHQPLETSSASQSTSLEMSRACQSSQGHQPMEPLVPSPKESPRKRVGMSTDGPSRVPEVRAIQQTRRLLANARERTRVHTISAAFEALRKQVPCYSYGQKLSKLAILRIACNYILSLAQLAELDYSPDHNSLTFSQCVEQCTNTLQAEGRSKKRKVGRMPEDV